MSQGDSHLTAAKGALFGSGPAEDNPGTGSPLSSGVFLYGVGSYLQGAWGIPMASPGSSVSLAYIVVPCGSEFIPDIRVRVANISGDIIASLSTLDFVPFVDLSLELGDLGPLVGDVRLSPPGEPTIVSGKLPVSYDGDVANLTWMIGGPATGPGQPAIAPSVDPASGLFSWDVTGSKAGTYTFPIKATYSGFCFSQNVF